MDYIDIISTIFQSILFIYTINYCLGYKKIFDRKLVLSVIILSIIGYIIPNKFGNVSICVFVTHMLCMLVIIFFYNKKYIEALLALNLSYSIVMLSVFTFGNLFYEFIEKIIFKEHNDMFKALFIYLFQFAMCITCMKFAKLIKQFYKILLDREFSLISILLFSFIPDFVISFYIIRYKNEPPLLKNVIFMLLIIFIIISIVYFVQIKERANKIYKLNQELEIKNVELTMIKNTYGMQMSSLYELCMMEQYENVSSLLKSTINVAGKTNKRKENKVQESILSYATKHITSEDINIEIEEHANLALLAISEMELYRIVVNIVNNAVKAMKNKGRLTIRSYNKDENIIIEIENDGEKIPEGIINKIFKSGFTTKEDDDKNHGYGLSIVKELIENYNGKIFVESNEVITRFIIDLPIDKLEDSIVV